MSWRTSTRITARSPKRTSRGLVGHSMGGYGATRIGMKHADVFGSLYIMSPCCLSPRAAGPGKPGAREGARGGEDAGRLAKLPFMARAQLASAAAWSPNPEEPAALPRPADEGRRRRSPTSSRNGPRTRRSPSSISTSATFAAIGHRDRCRRPGRSAHRHGQAARRARQIRDRNTASRSIPEPTPAASPTAFRITCCPSSTSTCASMPAASNQMTATCAGGAST